MKRAAIVGALSCAALAAAACTNDFDALFVDGKPAEKGDDDDTTSSSGKPGPGPVKPAIACGAKVETCSISSTAGDTPSSTCSGCGCDCGLFQCPDGKGKECALGCVGGSNCKASCDSVSCSVSTDQSLSDFTCAAFTCLANCKNGSSCTVRCEDTESCVVTCDPSSTCTVFCPEGDGNCNVTCGKGQPATVCSDGSRVCGECPG